MPIGTLVYEKTGDPDNPTSCSRTSPTKASACSSRAADAAAWATRASRPSTNRAPRKVQPGEPGEEKDLRLELKLLADVGLVGFPNAGKSTLIARISAARPKIADYPFTTLTPNLGVVRLSDDRSFVVADVPGLIEGAHRGLGLGHQFLRHLERTKVLVHLVDVSSATGRDPVEDLDTVRRELELFQPTLAAKPQIVAANKIDAVETDARRRRGVARSGRRGALGLPFFRISGVTGAGVPELLEACVAAIAGRNRAGHRCRHAPTDRHPRRHLRSDSPRTPRRRPRRRARARPDALFVITANIPPHRPQPLASGYHRFAMVGAGRRRPRRVARVGSRAPGRRAVVHDRHAAAISRRAGTSPTELFFVIGADAFADIASWKDYPAILDRAHFAVVSRPGCPVDELPQTACRSSPRAWAVAIRSRRVRQAPLIFLIDAPTADVSSTAIRRRLSEGESIAGLVPPAVQQHIEQHGLYTSMIPGRRRRRRAHRRGRQVAWPRLRKRRKAERRPKQIDRAVRAAEDKKATDLVVLDLRKAAGFTDFFVICSGSNPRQIRAIADGVMEALAAEGVKPAHVEGYDRSEWVLLDYFDFIVHVFAPETRLFYGLERLWGQRRAHRDPRKRRHP